MALVTTKRNVDVLPGQAAPTVFHCSQHDVGATIILGLVNAGGNYSIPSGVTAIIQGSCSNGAVFTPVTATVSGSDITFNLSAEMTSIAGPTVCEAVLSKDTDVLGTANFILDVEPSAMGSDTPPVFADAAWLWMVNKMGSETVSALGDKTVINAINEKADQSDVTALSDAKLDKNQGTANAGKYLKVGTDGNVAAEDLDVTTDKTLSIADKAADAKSVGDELDDLKADLNKTAIPIYKVGIDNTDNNLRQPFHIKPGDTIAIRTADGSNFAGSDQLRFYDVNGEYFDNIATVPNTVSIRVHNYQYAEAFYIGITRVASVDKEYIVENYSNEYNLEQPIKNAQNDISQLQTKVEIIENDMYEQTVILTDNSLHAFPISNGTSIIITTEDGTTLPEGNPYFRCYNSERAYLGQFLCSSAYGTSRTVTISYDDVAYVGMYTTPSKPIKVYIPDSNKLIPKVEKIANIVGQNTIIVDASGAGDYTSFTQAIYDTVDSGRNVYVKPGTYNIVSEYVALFRQSAVDSMADSDSAIFNGFQYGVRLRKRKVEFAPGARLVCDWTGHTVDGTHRFSALGVDYDVEIIGLDLDATATFYCIHDDYGIATPYTVKYENCRVVGHNIYNANCIGGGCKKYSRHILNNCYFDNNLTGSATVRYHNTNAEGAEPEIYVSNCYFNNWFTPRWYGTQTSKMKVYVNNCEARSIHKLQESASFTVDNVELYKWCNTETAPVT